MTPEELRAIIAASGGDKAIWGFSFDGNGETIFRPDQPFSSSMIDDTSKCLRFEEVDENGLSYTIWKPIATIFAIITIDDVKNALAYSPRALFG